LEMKSPHPAPVAGTLLVLTSLGSLAVVTVLTLWAGALTPGYRHVSQFISELGETGAPYEWPVRLAGCLPAGLLVVAFAVLAFRAIPRSRSVTLGLFGLVLYAVGYLAAVVYPCDAGCRPDEPSTSQLIHSAAGMLGYLATPAFLFTLARATRDWPGATPLAVTGYAASAVALAGLLTLSPASDVVGLSQRAIEYSVLGWISLLGIYLAKQSRR
jgi:hypothetical protein